MRWVPVLAGMTVRFSGEQYIAKRCDVLSPIEIKKHEFSRAFRGYDPDEVRGFLDSLAGEVERLSDQYRTQTLELERLKSETTAFQRVEQNLKDALVQAQENLKKAEETSRREADLVIKEAQFEAEKIIRDARRKTGDIESEIEQLSVKRDSFVRKLRILLSSELEILHLLENFDADDKLKGGSAGRSKPEITPEVIPDSLDSSETSDIDPLNRI